MLDLLDESPWSLVVPRASPGPRGATGVPATVPVARAVALASPSSSLETYIPVVFGKIIKNP